MMKALRHIALAAVVVFVAACTEPPPPRTVSTFLEHPNLLEAALVRCTKNRSESRYDTECLNAREAVKRIEAKDEATRRADLEVQSQRKRDALRRTQRAATEARRRTAEYMARSEEAAYLAQFGETPAAEERSAASNKPLAIISEAVNNAPMLPTGSNVPIIEVMPKEIDPDDAIIEDVIIQQVVPQEEPVPDLESVRENLQQLGNERPEL